MALGIGFGSYNMAMAALSPCPLLQGSVVGETIIVSETQACCVRDVWRRKTLKIFLSGFIRELPVAKFNSFTKEY